MGYTRTRVTQFLLDYPVLLVVGAGLGFLWANLAGGSYHLVHDYVLWQNAPIGALHSHGDGHVTRDLTVHFVVNDMLMPIFFFVVGKEIYEAIVLKDGKLRGRTALLPFFAAIGGMIGPAFVYLGGAFLLGSATFAVLQNGWAIPTATDIAFSLLVSRLVFGPGHPAVAFLLTLAVADDILGIMILATLYPKAEIHLAWLLLSVGVTIGVYLLANTLPRYLDRHQSRKRAGALVLRFGLPLYVVAGIVSWYGFMRAGIHPALGLMPLILAIPHAERDLGIFAREELSLHDPLNELEHRSFHLFQTALFAFGLMNAGVEIGAVSAVTWLVFSGLLLGKPLGIMLMVAAVIRLPRRWGFLLPHGMTFWDVFLAGLVAAVGFTVALFVATVAFPPGDIQDGAKMGALLSVFVGALPIALAYLRSPSRRLRHQ